MEHAQDWPARVAAQVGERIAYFRASATDARGRKLTAQALADRCADLGLPLGRPTIAKLEKGLRQSITVAEVAVLAKALNVSPADLIFPLGKSATVEVLPGQHSGTWDAVQWFSGFAHQPGLTPTEDYEGVVHLYQVHQVIMDDWRTGKAQEAERLATRWLQAVRTEMRRRDLLPPELPPELAYVDNGDAS